MIKYIEDMENGELNGLIRHALTFIGGIFVSKGYLDEQTLLEVIGATMTLGGFVWSFISKKKKTEE